LTDQAIRVVPAGWYEDPASRAHVRWWNGLAWTEHTALKPTPVPVVVPPPVTPSYGQYGDAYATGQNGTSTQTGSTQTGSTQTPETLARIAEARDLERQYGISTAENDIIMRAAREGHRSETSATTSDYRPWNAEPEPVYEEPSTSTASAWFIALWPLFTLAAAAVAAYLAFYVMPEPSFAGIPVIAAVALVPTVLTLIWAATDAHRLRSRDFEPAPAALALLGPLVYLIGRRARVKGSGPLVTLILLTLVAVGGPTAAFFTGTAVPVTKALEIQQAVQAEYVASGELVSVSCPVFVENLQKGSLYECRGVLPDGGRKIVWVSIDTEDLDFSFALAVR
jgi:hypothetical protein